MKTCLNCWRAGEGRDENGDPWPRHCGDCPCCRVCQPHKAAGCPICNKEDE